MGPTCVRLLLYSLRQALACPTGRGKCTGFLPESSLGVLHRSAVTFDHISVPAACPMCGDQLGLFDPQMGVFACGLAEPPFEAPT